MADKLTEICAVKRQEVAARRRTRTIAELDADAKNQSEPRGFEKSLRRTAESRTALIAEIKRASPSRGIIRANFEPRKHARDYEAGGACCLSVLTDSKFFQGSEAFLIEARAAVSLPVLRKDFIVDPWQVAEARAIGADAILLVVAALDMGALLEIEDAALQRGMDVLVEVHDAEDLERALRLRSRLIGINNRNLRTFTTDIAITESLTALIPQDRFVVSESGIHDHEDIQRLTHIGVQGFLVGESLMKQHDLQAATRSLLEGSVSAVR